VRRKQKPVKQYRSRATPSIPANKAQDDFWSPQQQTFLRRVAVAVPQLFNALQEGNVKSELILGLRRVRNRQARLKLVAELVDPGANPLQTHGVRNTQADKAADASNALGNNDKAEEPE